MCKNLKLNRIFDEYLFTESNSKRKTTILVNIRIFGYSKNERFLFEIKIENEIISSRDSFPSGLRGGGGYHQRSY